MWHRRMSVLVNRFTRHIGCADRRRNDAAMARCRTSVLARIAASLEVFPHLGQLDWRGMERCDRYRIGYRLDVDCVSAGVKAVAGLDRRCLQVFGAEYRVDEVVIASDEGRVEVDLGSDAPGVVRGPDEAW